jgi:thymidylate synthase ThyX
MGVGGDTGFSEKEKKALEVFFTSAEAPIYAARFNLPPEVFGAFGSYFSRNPKDVRDHVLDAMYGRIKGFEEEVGDSNIEWLAKGDFRGPFEAIQSGLKRSQKFFEDWYGKYSHKSIANTVWIPMVANNVSQLFARELAVDQLAFFIEQSTRYVKWGLENMFKDPEVMVSEHGPVLEDTLSHMANAYHELSEIAVDHYRKEIPFETWKTWQTDDTLGRPVKSQRVKYDREIGGAALDVSRFLLPQACQTNIAWILDARSTELDISKWKGHPLQEMREDAELIETAAGEIAPSLLKHTEPNDYYGRKLRHYDGALGIPEPSSRFDKGVSVISSDPDALDKSVAHILHRHNARGSFSDCTAHVSGMSFDQKIDVLRTVTDGRGSHDEWVEADQTFGLVPLTIEIRSDIGAIRDWRRHQKWNRSEPPYTLDNGVHKPARLVAMGNEAERVFDESVQIAYDAEVKIREDFPEQAQYVVPMATNHTITMAGDLDQAQYMFETRTTPQANFSYRADAFKGAEAVVRENPWMLGYEEYPEGKDFVTDVYENAPLKGVIRLQTDPDALHQ